MPPHSYDPHKDCEACRWHGCHEWFTHPRYAEPDPVVEPFPFMSAEEQREADFELAERGRYADSDEYWSDEDAAQAMEAERNED